MIVAGLTGSIGMGKSTTAGMLREFGIPVFDADQCVHRLYDGEALEPIGARFPECVINGKISRDRLAESVVHQLEAMRDLEAIIHPMVAAARRLFLTKARIEGVPLAVVDIPLLFEVGEWRSVDVIVVVTASCAIQHKRVLARPNMTEQKFRGILSRQLPDAEKRQRAHFLIETDMGFEPARRQARRIAAALRSCHC